MSRTLYLSMEEAEVVLKCKAASVGISAIERLPDAGIAPTPFQAAIIGMGLNGAAYLAEIYRSGIEAIHRGQMEAALSLGMTPARAMKSR